MNIRWLDLDVSCFPPTFCMFCACVPSSLSSSVIPKRQSLYYPICTLFFLHEGTTGSRLDKRQMKAGGTGSLTIYPPRRSQTTNPPPRMSRSSRITTLLIPNPFTTERSPRRAPVFSACAGLPLHPLSHAKYFTKQGLTSPCGA